MIRRYWNACEHHLRTVRVRQGFIFGIKISPNVSSFLDPFLLQERNRPERGKKNQQENSFFKGCIKAGNWVKFQALKFPFHRLDWNQAKVLLKYLENPLYLFSTVTGNYTCTTGPRRLLKFWLLPALAGERNVEDLLLLCFAFDNQIQLQPVLWWPRDCGLSS